MKDDKETDSNSTRINSASQQIPKIFAEKFDALLADVLTGEPILRLEEEIVGLKEEIAANLKKHAVTPEQLQRRYRQLIEVKRRLKEDHDRLEAFLTAPEVTEIEAKRRAAEENGAKIERIARFDKYFQSLSAVVDCLRKVKETHFAGSTEEDEALAKESLVKARELLAEISQMREGLFPVVTKAAAPAVQYSSNLPQDFEQILTKLTADVEEWTAVLMPETLATTSTTSDAEAELQKHRTGGEPCASNPHQEFVIRTKRILVSSSSSSENSLASELISSEEVLASFKLAQSKSSKVASRLPPLKISRLMVEIKDVIEEMSALFSSSSPSSGESKSESSNLLAVKEVFADVCELFLSTAPYLFFRSQADRRDPRRSAVAHNNCVFFAHLIELVQQANRPHLNFLNEQPSAASVNYLSAIRELASNIFRQQMQFEEERLLSVVSGETPSATAFTSALAEIANETPATELKVSSVAHFDFRRTLNDCLSLLGNLREAFADGVLPEKLCSRAFSTLVSSLLTAFLAPIVALSDISSLGASHLAHELDYFSGELKPFLADASGGGSVAKWIKLNEINFILKSSLLEIVNRWADGSGLLASYLTAEEVKHLVRALFQNTERRSKALAKIK